MTRDTDQQTETDHLREKVVKARLIFEDLDVAHAKLPADIQLRIDQWLGRQR